MDEKDFERMHVQLNRELDRVLDRELNRVLDRELNRGLNRELDREGQRLLLTDLEGNPIAPTKIANAMLNQCNEAMRYERQAKDPFQRSSATHNKFAITGGLIDTIKSMDEATRQAVFAEIEKVKAESLKKIDANGWEAGCENLKACNLLNSFKSTVEEKEKNRETSKTQILDDGRTM